MGNKKDLDKENQRMDDMDQETQDDWGQWDDSNQPISFDEEKFMEIMKEPANERQ